MTQDEKKLYIVDGHALAYRSYYATIRASMTNSSGVATGALFGFASSLIALLDKYMCAYLTVVFDSPKPTFRHAYYDQYKAHRKPMPDEMVAQMPLIMELVDNLNIPRISIDGLEADDIIANLTKKAKQAGFTVYLVTKDKDLMQLVGADVKMLTPESGGKLIEMGADEVTAKMGVPPEQIRDLLALMGDSSDNIPGLPGVGPKTAIKILLKAGTIDNLLENPSLVENKKLQAKIEENIEILKLSKKLVTLKTDDDIGITLEELKAREIHKDACAAFFNKMDFHSFLKSERFEIKKELAFKVTVPKSVNDVKAFISQAKSAGILSVDTETTSTNPRDAELVGISCAIEHSHAMYIPVGHKNDQQENLPIHEIIDCFKDILESTEIGKIGQNLKYDYQVFKNYGIHMKGIVFDTMVAAYVIEPGKRQYGMDNLALQWLQMSVTSIETLIGKGKSQICFSEVPVQRAAEYSGEDAIIPLLLKEKMHTELDRKGVRELYENIEMPLITVLAEMEWAGILLDSSHLKDLSQEYGVTIDSVTKEIFDLAGEEFNLNSPKQIAEILFTKLHLPKSRKTKTGLSTDVDALEKLAVDFPIAKKLLQYRENQKLLSTYIDALPGQVLEKSGRLHSSFNQTIAATGRLSSTNPNLQNIPIRTEAGVRIREAFVARRGYRLVSADYSQIELRLLAHLSGDSLLRQAFHEDRDIHAQTASAIFGCFVELVSDDQRRMAKTINFGLMYGMGPHNLSRQLGISFREAQKFIDTYFDQFPSVRDFMDKCVQRARESGYTETMFGRRRYLPEILSEKRQIRESAERIAINTPVQGTAADIIKIAMIHIQKDIGKKFPDAEMILQVHDELVFETPKESSESLQTWVVEKMSSACKLSIPLKVDAGIGKNWREAH